MHTPRTLTVIVGGLVLSHAALASDINKKDAEYLQKAAQGTMSEVKLGEMAQKQAADERVKQFGKRMVGDHGKDLQDIRQLASQKHVTLPDGPNKEQSKEADRLTKLSGADFDVKHFASAEYQTVVAHKKEIDDIHTQLGK